MIEYHNTQTTKQIAKEKLTELQNLNFKIIAMANKIKKEKCSDTQLNVMLSQERLLTREYLEFTKTYSTSLRQPESNKPYLK